MPELTTVSILLRSQKADLSFSHRPIELKVVNKQRIITKLTSEEDEDAAIDFRVPPRPFII